MRYLLLTWTVLSLSFCLGCGSSTDSDFGDDVAVSVDLSYQHTADMADVREGDGSFFDSTPEVSPEVSEETVPDAIEDAEISEAPDRQEQAPDEEEAPDEEVACVPDCSGRTCGPDPVCGELCGSCDDPDFPACNDGVCEFTCDESACSAQTFCDATECEPDCVGEDCTPEELCSYSGLETCYVYSCSADQTCDMQIEAGESCSRDTENEVVSDESLGECVGANLCSANGEQEVLAVICQAGEPSVEPAVVASQECELSPVAGDLLGVDPGTCSYPSDSCAIQGIRREATARCDGSGGAAITERTIQDASCVREIDSETVIDESLQACASFDKICDTTGFRTRTRTYCDGTGSLIDRDDSVSCSRTVSSDTAVGEPEVGECGGFDDICDTTGTRTVTQTFCDGSGGSEVRTVTEECLRTVSSDTTVGAQRYGACGNFDSVCDTTGARSVAQDYCDGSGGIITEDSAEGCTREVSSSTPSGQSQNNGSCSYSSQCSVTGTRSETRYYCDGAGGTRSQTTTVAAAACNRTVNTSTPISGPTLGACGGYAHVCDTTGTRTETSTYCDGSGGTRTSSTTGSCGRAVSTAQVYSDSWSACSYADPVCSPQATATRTTARCDGFGGVSAARTTIEARTCNGSFCTSCPTQGVDYTNLIPGTGSNGACTQASGHVCTEDGTRTVTGQVCTHAGGRTTGSTTESCFWNSDGNWCSNGTIHSGICGDEVCCESGSSNTSMLTSTDVTVVTNGRSTSVYDDNLLHVGTDGLTSYFAALRFNTGTLDDGDNIRSINLSLTPGSTPSTATTVLIYPITCLGGSWSSSSFPCSVNRSNQIGKVTIYSGSTISTALTTTLSQLSGSGIAIVPAYTTQNITFLDQEKAVGSQEPQLQVSYSRCD